MRICPPSLLLALAALAACAPPADAPPPPALVADTAATAPADLSGPFASVRVREWTLDDGLPTPVLSVAQDPDGYLWATTEQGAARFDGVRFTRFTEASTPALASEDVLGLLVTAGGDVWVGDRERRVFRFRDGAWTAYDLDGVLRQGRWVRRLVEDADGHVWAATGQGSIARFDGATWSAVRQAIAGDWAPFAADADGAVWTTLPTGRIARWDGQRFVPSGLDGLLETPSSGPVVQRAAGADAEGRVRVEVLDLSGERIGGYRPEARPMSVMLVDRSGRLWLQPRQNLDRGELLVIDDGEVVYRFAPDGATAFEEVVEDRQGSIWAHARSTGLFQLTAEPFRRYGSPEGMPRDLVRVDVAPDGAVVASPQPGRAGVETAVLREGALTRETFAYDGPTPLRSRFVSDGRVRVGRVVTDAAGQRWGSAGTHLFRLGGGRAELVAEAPRGITATLAGAPGEVWIGTGGGEVARVDPATGTFPETTDLGGTVSVLHRSADGQLWAGGDGGLVVRREDGAWETALAGVAVRDLREAPGGAVWVATDGHGLLRLRGTAVDTLHAGAGLPSDHLGLVLLDEADGLWTSVGRALYRLPLAATEAFLDGEGPPPEAVELLPSAGHLGVSRRMGRAAVAPDGAFWIPSARGLTRLDPAAFAARHASPSPVIVEAFEAGGQSFRPAPDLRLPVGARTLDVAYTATDLLGPGLVRFRTWLVGHDDGWVDRGTARRATYGGLGPGTYTLRVQALSAVGTWSEAAATPAFVVPPRLHETGWMRALAALALLGLGVAGYRARVRTLTARERELGALVGARTAELEAEKETVAAQARSLEALDEAKTRLFANVSHEFRTPLTLTIGPLDDVLAGEHGPIPETAQSQLALARRSAARVLDLVGQILDVARLESGQTALEAQPLDLGAFVTGVAAGFAPLAERKAIALETRVPDAPVAVAADPAHLEKALANLLANALKFSPTGGAVRLTVAADAETARVAVRDSGPGIAPDDLPHVFDRFYQAAEGATPTDPGTGIGLALAREVATLHGGALTVESEVGFGSLFTLSLPLGEELPDGPLAAAPAVPARPPAPTAPAPPDPDDGDDRTTVLVVEDHAEVRAFVRRHLASTYRVLEAADGAEGVAMALEHLPDLVLADVMMPEMDGLALCAALKADPETDFIPVVLLTARAEAEDRLAGLAGGADDYLTKPFDVRELRARVGNLIAGRRRLRERLAEAAGGDGALHAAPVSPASADDVFLASVREAVEQHLDDEAFSVERLAEAVGVSRGHLHRQLRALDGRTPSEVIRTMRLERAAQLLEARAGTVSETAYAVGFKSVSHFSNAFAAHFGVRPSAYPAEA